MSLTEGQDGENGQFEAVHLLYTDCDDKFGVVWKRCHQVKSSTVKVSERKMKNTNCVIL